MTPPPPPPRKPRTPTLQLHAAADTPERQRISAPAPLTAAAALQVYQRRRNEQRRQQAHKELLNHLAAATIAADAAPHHEASEHVLATQETQEAQLTPEQQAHLRAAWTQDAVTAVRSEQLKQRVSSMLQSDRAIRAVTLRDGDSANVPERSDDANLRGIAAQSMNGSGRDVLGGLPPNARPTTSRDRDERDLQRRKHAIESYALRIIAIACLAIVAVQGCVYAYILLRLR